MAKQNLPGFDFSDSELLAEIKEMSEKNLNDDLMVLSIAAGFTQPAKPHLEFEYPDLEIQEDIYQLMKYSCREVCTPEQCDKVMKIWTTFLEPLIGVPACPPSAEDKNYVVKTNNHSKQNLKKQIGQENSSHADEDVYCKAADMPKSGDEHVPPEDSFPSRVQMARGNNGNSNNGSPGVDNVASKSDILCNASLTGAGDNIMNEENASATQKEAGHANAYCGIEVVPSRQSQNGALSKLNACSSEMVLEEFKIQKHHEENEIRSKGAKEEGEVSPNRNLEENSFVFFENTETKTEQTLSKSDPIVGTIGEEEVCVEEAGEETNANGNDDGEENASGSESANGETLSPEEPGDGDHDENDKKARSEGEADCMMDVDDTEGAMPISDRLLQTVKPLTVNIPSALKGKEKSSHIFYGNDSFYLLFRLHQMLYERLLTAKLHSSSPDNKRRISNDASSEDSYARFKDALNCLLNGSYDSIKFEDECRALVGAQSYILFTLDKLIHKLVKQLQIISSEELDSRLLHLYAYERSRSPETFCDGVYYENARFLLLDDSLYRIEFLSRPMRLTMRLMKTENDKLDPIAVSMDPYFASYLNDELLAVPEKKGKSGVFLKRNKKLYSGEDEYSNTSKAMEGLVIRNGVEMKVNSSTLKISYVLGTEDFMYRPRKTRRALYGKGASNGTPDGCLHRAKRCKLFHD